MEVNPESPFEGDALSREQSCNDLADFIAEAETPYVLAVDAPWGAGKTVFARMLQAVCIRRNLPTVFFNAWEADFHNDALAAMIGEVSGELKSEELADTVRKTGKALLSRHMATTALKTIANAAGAGVLAEGVDKALEKFDVAEGYRKRRDALKEFQEALFDYAAQNGGRLVFFVDELDRCRPVFAVEVLEKIKHIFAAEGVFFVVSVNKEQLGKTIKSVYGDIDADVYLRRFFDRDYTLVNRGGFIASVLENLGFVEHMRRRNELYRPRRGETSGLDPQYEIERIAALCDAYKFSLRDCEQVAHTVAHALMNCKENILIFPDIVAFFAAMSVADPQRFAEYHAIVADSASSSVQFPFAELAEYYKESTGLIIEKTKNGKTSNNELLERAYAWCCANRYVIDAEYRAEVNAIADSSAKPERSFMLWVRKLAESRSALTGDAPSYKGVDYYPKLMIEAVARFGKRQFGDGN